MSQLFAIPWTTTCWASLSFIIAPSVLKLMPIELVMPSNHLILCCPLLLLPSILPSIMVFSRELAFLIRWPKCWSFNFRIDWFYLLAIQGTLQHHSMKASIIWHSTFLMVQLSHPYMITGNTIALTIWTFVSKMSLRFNMLSRFVIGFLPRSKHLLISWLQSPSA